MSHENRFRALRLASAGLLLATLPLGAQDEPGKGLEPPPNVGREITASGGPDGFGYTYVDSNEADGPVFSWVDISGTGTALGLGDDAAATVNLTFEFPFYGFGYRTVRVSNNGTLILSSTIAAASALNVCPVPGVDLLALITPRLEVFWDDVDSDTGNVYHQEFASCPATGGGTGRCWVVEWFDRPHFSNTGSATFEAILYENGSILYQYLDTDFGSANFDDGASASIGIEDDATNASWFLEYSCNDAGAVPDSTAILWLQPERSCVQSFDLVTPPTLPTGWSAITTVGDATGWVIQGTSGLNIPDTPANRTIIGGTGAGADDHSLQSQTFTVATTAAKLSFRQVYNHPNANFGARIEISINAGPFTDLVAAGGSFVQNGYTGVVGGTGALAGQSGWTNGSQLTYQTVIANLPPTVVGDTVQFRFRRAKNNGISLAFWVVDTVAVSGCSSCQVTCPADIATGTEAPACTADVDFAFTSLGACAPVNCDPASGSAFGLGTTPVTCEEFGTPALACTFDVDIADDDDPTVQDLGDQGLGTDPGVCTAVATYVPTFADNCPGPSLLCSPVSGTAFPTGTTPVTCTVTDGAGNDASDGFSITVTDDELPTIQDLGDQSLGTDPGLCSAVATYAPNFADNCPAPGLVCSPVSGTAFATGTTPVSCTVTDGQGLQASDGFSITVTDDEAPTIEDLGDQALGTDPGLCSAVATYAPGYDDNCPGGGVVCAPPSGTAFALGTTPVLCTATDVQGLQATDGFDVDVADDELPLIECPADLLVDDLHVPGEIVDFDAPLVSDNCTPPVAICEPPSGALFPPGETTVDCSATDVGGGVAECAFAVDVERLPFYEIPTLSRLGLAALALLVAGFALLALRRS